MPVRRVAVYYGGSRPNEMGAPIDNLDNLQTVRIDIVELVDRGDHL